ncbi:monooxygenase [Salinicoccus sp. RF5]|uniref:monooxygenase n=1 Tax=Salinicoccus sp. RF5 TaxID=2748874 RepID=UPI001E64858B|nr:monooxygenase [Salinicoccus sp. RF5]MCC4722301.1 monooxygenase [Salinicoccus sp. RF5]
MAVLLQVDFEMEGPFGTEMAEGFRDLAESINEEPGFLWKIWTENENEGEAGGIYVFETKEDAENYLKMHTERLAGFGITDVNGKIFNINQQLSKINNAPME